MPSTLTCGNCDDTVTAEVLVSDGLIRTEYGDAHHRTATDWAPGLLAFFVGYRCEG